MVCAMPENLDPGRGPARQVLYAQGEQRQERNPRWQFDRRAEQHLGSTFHSVGDIRNFVSRLDPTYNVNKVDTNLDNSKNQAGNTRVMVWNAGGGAGTHQRKQSDPVQVFGAGLRCLRSRTKVPSPTLVRLHRGTIIRVPGHHSPGHARPPVGVAG